MKKMIAMFILVAIVGNAFGQSFKEQVGSVSVRDVNWSPGKELYIPYILWGGDMSTQFANGGLKTRTGSIFALQGLNINLVPGDDFVQQVRNYLSGKSPFLRGTFGQLALASEVIGADPRTKGVIVFQLTWSTGGDHLVIREAKENCEIVKDANGKEVVRVKKPSTIADMKGGKFYAQRNGPHQVGFLKDILDTARISPNEVNLVFVDDITGPKGPAEAFKKDPTAKGCFVVTPDAISLTGGSVGKGGEGTVFGARDVVNSGDLTYSIADMYLVRKDFADAHPDVVTKFAAGYLKACEEVIELKKAHEKTPNAEYKKLLQMAQDIWGKEAIPTLDDAHGLLCDCTFVGHPGNVAFFTDAKNLHGFNVMQEKTLGICLAQGYTSVKQGFFTSPLDWNSKAFIGYLTKTEAVKGNRFKVEAVAEEIEKMNSGALDSQTISPPFYINFDADQTTFSETAYGVEYQRVVEDLGKFGGAAIVIRGHTDTTKTIATVLRIGIARGIIKQTGTPGNFQYSIEGRNLDMSSMGELARMIEDGKFELTDQEKRDMRIDATPRELVAAALTTSKSRAENVRDSVVKFAESKGVKIDKSQIQAIGAGIKEPFIVKPRNMEEAAKNRRVEFRLIRVSAESVSPSDFNY